MSDQKPVYHTISAPLKWSGKGLHTGETCTVSVVPAEEFTGIRWRRGDIADSKSIPLDPKYIVSTDRGTDIAKGDMTLKTVEHLLAAMYGAGVTAAEIVLEGPEIPILDGSAARFYEDLVKARVPLTQMFDKTYVVQEIIEVTDEVSGASYTLLPHDTFEVDVMISYDSSTLGHSYASYQEGGTFDDIASARTFALTTELKELCERGLIKGGDLDNAVLIPAGENPEQQIQDALSILGRTDAEELLSKFKDGTSLNSPNEAARHKLLDLLGDISILGCKIQGKIIAKKPGHTGNAALAKHLKPLVQKQLKQGVVPKYDPRVDPVYETVDIQGFLPHRYPFLMVDKIIKLTDDEVVGIKNISFDAALFQGHFPDNPVFPGVLQLEALAQTGGILALSKVPNPSDWDTYFVKMDAVKFRRKVLPGDTLILKMKLISPVRRGMVHMKGTTYVGEHIAAEGELTAQIVDRTTL